MWKLPGETPGSLRFGWAIKLWRAKAGCDSPPINEYSKLYGWRSRAESQLVDRRDGDRCDSRTSHLKSNDGDENG